jgi:serine/threonine protein kinase
MTVKAHFLTLLEFCIHGRGVIRTELTLEGVPVSCKVNGGSSRNPMVSRQFLQSMWDLPMRPVCSAEYSFPKGAVLSPGFIDLLSKILVPNFQERISLNEIFEHPWFIKELPEGVKSRRYNLSPEFATREVHLLALFKANEDRRANSGRLSGKLAGR